MKKLIFKILKILIIGLWIFFVLGFAIKQKSKQRCTDLVILLDNNHKFVNNEIIENLLKTNNIILNQTLLDSLNFEKIEKLIETLNGVKEAQVYHDIKGKVYIEIKQRNPVMRVICSTNKSYYVDDEFKIVDICPDYTANVIVVSGNIDENLFKSVFTSEGIAFREQYGYSFYEIYELVKYINNHDLWKHQFEQIYIAENNDIELVPRVGEHIIILGSPENYKYKLGKLEAMYSKGFSLTDWNKYKSINLKFSNQVICKKK